jgi:hypothetical protein
VGQNDYGGYRHSGMIWSMECNPAGIRGGWTCATRCLNEIFSSTTRGNSTSNMRNRKSANLHRPPPRQGWRYSMRMVFSTQPRWCRDLKYGSTKRSRGGGYVRQNMLSIRPPKANPSGYVQREMAGENAVAVAVTVAGDSND